MRNIIYFGTSANPFHLGHLGIVKEISERYKDDIILIDVCPNHIWGKDLANYDARRMIANVSTLGIPNCVVLHTDSKHALSTVDRLDELYVNGIILPNQKITLVVGMDQYRLLHRWDRFEWLINQCEFLVIPRSKTYIGQGDVYMRTDAYLHAGHVNAQILEGYNSNISSTEIREIIQKYSLVNSRSMISTMVHTDVIDDCINLYYKKEQTNDKSV